MSARTNRPKREAPTDLALLLRTAKMLTATADNHRDDPRFYEALLAAAENLGAAGNELLTLRRRVADDGGER